MSGDAWERARSPPEAPFWRIPRSAAEEHGRKGEYDMQQSTNANIEQRFGHALAEVRSIIDEHEKMCAERVQAAEGKAQADINRFEVATAELAQARRELSALSVERASLPLEAYTASMDGDVELEATLKARYASIAPEHIEHLRGRIEALEREVAELGGTESGAAKRAYTNARDAYTEVLRDLEAFEERIGEQKAAVEESQERLWAGRRAAEEQLSFLRGIEQAQRREERAEAAKREEAGRAVTGTRGKVVG